MIQAENFLHQARQRGFDFYTGVPCSFLTPLINRVINDPDCTYVGATSEGEALGIAAGAWLAGHQSVVLCQNSGLGNTVNPITSLNHPFRIPALLIVTWRGGPEIQDEPQHALMGDITPRLLELMGIAHRPFPKHDRDIAPVLDQALAGMQANGLPFALIMEKGDVQNETLSATPMAPRARGKLHDHRSQAVIPRREEALAALLKRIPQPALVIATTGKTGRELFTLADRPQHLYQVGSMGCASAMGLGLALHSGRAVVVIDGDGAALMKLGNLATIGACAPRALVHLLLDNGVHDSTGGQPTVAANVDFAAAAIAGGYAVAHRCDDIPGLNKALNCAFEQPGPQLIHMRIRPGSREPLGRPAIPPDQVARRLREFITT